MEETTNSFGHERVPADVAESAELELKLAEDGDDTMRLKTLENLVSILGSELEGEQDQAGSTRP